MNKSYILSGILVSFLLVGVANAALLDGGEEYTLPKDEVVSDDLYVGGGITTISGRVFGDTLAIGGELQILGGTSGDVLALGGDMLVSGAVDGDVNIVGGDVNVLGSVGDDIRIVAGNVRVSSPRVGDDVVVLGGVVTLESGSRVLGDLVVLGGEVTIHGNVNGNVTIKAGKVKMNGTILGSSSVTAHESLSIGETANLGTLTLRSPQEAVVAEGAKLRTEIDYEAIEEKDSGLKVLGGGMVTLFLMIIVFALVSNYFASDLTGSVVEDAVGLFWKNVFRGAIILIVVPVVSFLLLISILGVPLGLLLGLSYFILVGLAKLFTAIVLGSLVYKLVTKREDVPVSILTILLGVVLMAIILSIPVVGWVIIFLFFLASLGSISDTLHRKLND